MTQSKAQNPCPQCESDIPAANINIDEGAGLCPKCGKLSRLSEIVNRPVSLQELLATIPNGCTFEDRGDRVVIRATLHSWTMFLGSLVGALFAGGVAILLVSSLVVNAYAWATGEQVPDFPGIGAGQKPPELGGLLFFAAFATPFVVIGTILLGSLFVYLIGKQEIDIGKHDAFIRTGIGRFHWSTPFDPNTIVDIEYGETAWASGGRHWPLIELHGDKTLRFGSMLERRRMHWVAVVLYQLLIAKKAKQG